MEPLLPGTRVRHPKKPEWGIGQVTEQVGNDRVTVFFVEEGWKTLNPSIAGLERVQGEESDNVLLDNLSSAPRKEDRSYKSFSELIRIFTMKENFPEGFNGEKYQQVERQYKLDAHELMKEQLSEAQMQSLIDAGDYQEIARRAQRVIAKTNIVNKYESMAFGDGLKDAAAAKELAESLFGILYGDGEMRPRFEAYARALRHLGAAKWTVASYFPFIRFPERYFYLKPEVTQRAAAVCGFDIQYTTELNWTTFDAVQRFAQYLKKELASLNPKDMIDVQTFVWSTPEMIKGKYWGDDGGNL